MNQKTILPELVLESIELVILLNASSLIKSGKNVESFNGESLDVLKRNTIALKQIGSETITNLFELQVSAIISREFDKFIRDTDYEPGSDLDKRIEELTTMVDPESTALFEKFISATKK